MDHYPSYWMWARRDLSNHPRLRSTPGDSWDQEQAFAEDSSLALGGSVWPPRSYTCSFCRREFRSAQALGGHMNVHRRDRARLKQSSDNMLEDQADHHHQHALQLHNPLFTDVGAEYPPQICTNEEVSDNSYKHKTLVSPAYSFGAIIGLQQETHQRNLFSFMSSTLSSHEVVVSDSNHDVEDSRAEKNKFMSNQVQKEFVPKSDGVDSCCLVDSTRKRRQRSVDEDGVEEEDRDIHRRRRVVDLSLSFSVLSDNVSDSEKTREETSLLCFLEPSSGTVRRHPRSEIDVAHSSSEHLDLELRLGGFPKVI